MRASVVVASLVVVAGCGGRTTPPPPTPCETREGEVQTFDQALPALVSRLEVLLNEEAGGPVLCVPGAGECAACEGDRFDVDVGANVTVAVDVRNGESPQVTIPFTAALAAGSDAAFTLLEPVPASTSFDGPTSIFVGIAPVDVGDLDAFVEITATATNTTGRPPLLVGLRVRAVAP